ncbi:MAG: N-acyl homoserine lactonase family protein [Nocardioides sp.]|nr:N-acyl homoserine lactonase family protein [Nocardioides sp.]
MTHAVASRMWALEPATYVSPAAAQLLGQEAPRIPFPVYLVEHAEGLVLFDAGLAPEAAGDPGSVYGELAGRLCIDFAREHLIEHQLQALGFSLGEVTTVVASHLHFDHAGALKQFPHARTLIGSGEMTYALAPERFASGWYRREDFDDVHGIRWQEIPCDHDLFGDGAVTALHMPGHTPGSLALMVRLPGSSYVLTGDVVHTRGAYEGEIAYHGDVDTVAARQSLRKLKFLADTHRANVWIAHDPDDWVHWGGAGEKR